MKMKPDFVTMVSHELRTRLTAIKEGLSIAMDEATGKLNPRQKEFLQLAATNVERLERVINQVLDFERLESGCAEFHVDENNVNECVKEVRRVMAPSARQRGLELVVELDNALPKVQFDKEKIVKVLTNLVRNAIRFTDRGTVSILTRRRGNAVQVSVIDTGIGIDEAEIPRLFNEFERLRGVRHRGTGGIGLGLAICKRIIQMHGGDIRATSEPAKGSTFSFTLPIRQRKEALLRFT